MKEQINHLLVHLKVGEVFTERDVKLLNELRNEIENVLAEIKPLNQLEKEESE
jgi:hypothetical protein